MKIEKIDTDTNQRTNQEFNWISDFTYGALQSDEIDVRISSKNLEDNSVRVEDRKETVKGRPRITLLSKKKQDDGFQSLIKLPLLGCWRPEIVKKVGESYSVKIKGQSFSSRVFFDDNSKKEVQFKIPQVQVNYRVIAVEPGQVTIESDYTIEVAVNLEKENGSVLFHDVRTTAFRTSDGLVLREIERIRVSFRSSRNDDEETYLKVFLEKNLKTPL
jgi:outer membrane lipopolysaccharide assembly protein LptE/RlpB